MIPEDTTLVLVVSPVIYSESTSSLPFLILQNNFNLVNQDYGQPTINEVPILMKGEYLFLANCNSLCST